MACRLISNFVRLFVLFFFFAQTCLSCFAQEKLFSENAWHAVVVISDNPEIDEWYAARSLSDWAEVITGKKIDLISESERPPDNLWKIYVGKTQASIKNQVNTPVRQGDTAIRVIKDKSVYLLGSNPTATRIAVGRFCEQTFGITFCQPGTKGADYSNLKEVPIPTSDCFQPAFYWRAVGGVTNEISKDWVYSVGYGSCPAFSHNLYKIFTENEWKKDPSLFAEGQQGYIKPTGSGNDANPNLNHPQATTIARQYAENWFQNNPESTSVAMGLNDTIIFDKNVASEGWFRDRPVRTNYLIGFLNKVAEGNWLNPKNSSACNHAIGTLAYLDTLQAPAIKVNQDIFPWVCVDRIGYASEEFAQQDIENCTSWVKSGANYVGAYDYWYGNNFCLPRINFSTQARSIKILNQAGLVGWYAELYPIWAFDAPKAWLGSKLLENPAADSTVLLNQWFKSAYGPAEKPMRTIFTIIENEWSRTIEAQGKNQWLYGAFEESAGEILSDKAMDEISLNLTIAQKKLERIKKPNERERNYQWRLYQFIDAWNLVVDFREVVRLRKVQPTTPDEALVALKRLIEGEELLEDEQTRFNFKWGTTSQKIQWSRFTSTNPREKWMSLIKRKPELNNELLESIQEDIPCLNIFYWNHESKKSHIQILNSATTTQSLLQDWVIETCPRKNSEKLNEATSLLMFKNQSGVLQHTETLGAKKLIKFTLTHKPVGGRIMLLATFKGPDAIGHDSTGHERSLTRSQLVNESTSSLIISSPSWTERVEFKVQFENGMDLRALEISQMNL
jgi:Domain of unknown function (DUF4838)